MNKLTQSREIKKKMNKNRNEIKSLKMRMGKKYQKLENNEDQKIQIRPKASNVSNTTKTYVKNVKNNARKHKNHRLWSENIKLLFLGVLLMSYPCYRLLSQSLMIPSYSTLIRFMNFHCHISTDMITNIDLVHKICDKYRESTKLKKSIKIPGVLAVDAISFDPYIKIHNNGTVSGVIGHIQINNEELNKIKSVIKEQEQLIKNLKNITINSAFVYQFQPLSYEYKCFTVFVQASTSGKAKYGQISTLKKLSKILNENNVSVFSYASDGDSTYHPLIRDNVLRWNPKNRPILNFSKELFINNDPLHVLKRGRYKLISKKVCTLEKNSPSVSINNSIKEVLNLPSEVFLNSRFTKMHDDLPLKLFDIKVFQLLEEMGIYSTSSYYLPYTLLILSISNENITIDDRVDFLEIISYYMNFYKQLTKSVKNVCPQKSNNSCIIMFDNQMIDDLISTCVSINSFIELFSGSICLNRLGTNALEHHFGLMRLKAHYKHSYDAYLENEVKTKMLEKIENEILSNIVRSRKPTFGVTMEITEEIYGEKSLFTNEQYAYSILSTYGFPVKKLNFKMSKNDVHYAYLSFKQKLNRITEKGKRRCDCAFNSRDVAHSYCKSCGIRSRQDSASILHSDKVACVCSNNK